MEVWPGGAFIAGLRLAVGAAMMWREEVGSSYGKTVLVF